MNANQLRELTIEKLDDKLQSLKKDVVQLSFKHATAQLENNQQIKFVRKEIARIYTVLKEKELGKRDA